MLPHSVEDRELRIVYWRTLMSLLRVAHVSRFPNRSFGKDLQLIVVYGSVILAFLEGRKPTIANIARYLELPHETTRRYLKTIVDLGLLSQNGRTYNLPNSEVAWLLGFGEVDAFFHACKRWTGKTPRQLRHHP
jgi:hypothetical protein